MIRYTLILTGFIISLSLLSFGLNHYLFKFPGNNYFPDHTFISACILIINYVGLLILFGNKSVISAMGRELILFFTMMCVIALATNAVQLTPFEPIDIYIYSFERHVHINVLNIINWTANYTHFQKFLVFIYDTLPYQMALIPLIIILMRRFELIRNYYFLLSCTTLIGFLMYYFFPTSAPASIIKSPLFSANQMATGLKFNQIHHHIPPSTIEGGLIAFPSFHVIWAILCTYLVKDWLVPFIILAVFNGLLISSCVLLGWHFPIDVLGGFIVVGISFYFLPRYKGPSSQL